MKPKSRRVRIQNKKNEEKTSKKKSSDSISPTLLENAKSSAPLTVSEACKNISSKKMFQEIKT